MHYQWIASPAADDFTLRAIELLMHHINRAIEHHGSCIIGLSGGSTPKPVYEALGKADLDWSKVSIFLIDERYIEPSSPDSNQKLIRDSLLTSASIPEENMAFPDTTLPIHECVKTYGDDLKKLWNNRLPDIAVLGMGDDGHIASLFPPLTEKETHERSLVMHTTTDQFAVHDRITVSLHVIAAIDTHLFLLKGDKKKQVWDEMMASHEDLHRWPAKFLIQTSDVTALWTA